MTNKSQFNISA